MPYFLKYERPKHARASYSFGCIFFSFTAPLVYTCVCVILLAFPRNCLTFVLFCFVVTDLLLLRVCLSGCQRAYLRCDCSYDCKCSTAPSCDAPVPTFLALP